MASFGALVRVTGRDSERRKAEGRAFFAMDETRGTTTLAASAIFLPHTGYLLTTADILRPFFARNNSINNYNYNIEDVIDGGGSRLTRSGEEDERRGRRGVRAKGDGDGTGPPGLLVPGTIVEVMYYKQTDHNNNISNSNNNDNHNNSNHGKDGGGNINNRIRDHWRVVEVVRVGEVRGVRTALSLVLGGQRTGERTRTSRVFLCPIACGE